LRRRRSHGSARSASCLICSIARGRACTRRRPRARHSSRLTRIFAKYPIGAVIPQTIYPRRIATPRYNVDRERIKPARLLPKTSQHPCSEISAVLAHLRRVAPPRTPAARMRHERVYPIVTCRIASGVSVQRNQHLRCLRQLGKPPHAPRAAGAAGADAAHVAGVLANCHRVKWPLDQHRGLARLNAVCAVECVGAARHGLVAVIAGSHVVAADLNLPQRASDAGRDNDALRKPQSITILVIRQESPRTPPRLNRARVIA